MINQKSIIVVILTLLLMACGNPEVESDNTPGNMSEVEMKEMQFDLFEITLDSEVQVKKNGTEGDYSSWILEKDSEQITIQTIYNKGESASYPSISMYDTYLSTSISNRDKYSIDELEIDGTTFRLIERSFGNETNFIEYYAMDVCENGSQILITAQVLSLKNVEWLKECVQSIKIRCDE